MAEAVISPILELAIGTLTSSLIEEFRSIWGVEEELENLSSKLSTIQAVLADAEERQITDRAVRNWLGKLKNVAYNADDVLDEFVYEALRNRSKTTEERKQVCKFFLSCFGLNHVPFRRDIAHKIKDITKELDGISRDRDNLHLREGDGGRRNRDIGRPLTTSLMKVPESNVRGREKDRERIIELLVSEEAPSEKDVSVVSIVGMGGLGKTTLAQLVYNDTNVKTYFQLRAWVCVSEHFDISRLTKEIIESITLEKCDIPSIDPMQKRLQNILSGKRFLLVLDDVWSEKRDDWESLRAPFVGGAKGSKIIVTTRSEVVSKAMDTDHPHCLDILNDDDCLSLFKQCAFADGSSDAYPELVEMGRELVRRCKGLPLAVKALGGLLSTRDESGWRSVLESEIWSSQEDNDILPALSVSYLHLPTHVKQCFAYCSIFPKDYEFEKDTLVQLWMAQGFILQKEGKSLEDIGSEYFDYLLLRSFFQSDKSQEEQEYRRYKMHDLMHDLAQSISSDECNRIEHGKAIHVSRKSHRHLSLFANENTETGDLDAFFKFKYEGLRTSIFECYYLEADHNRRVSSDYFVKMRLLRVLVLGHDYIEELPNSFHIFKHLRYLDLSYTKITQVPESVSRCYNLQTLKLTSCYNLTQLPNETRKLLNLRHLNLEDCNSLKRMPVEIGRLTCLQTLSKFAVGIERGRRIGELKGLTKLKGALEISNLQNVENGKEAEEVNLKNKPHIDELELDWSGEHAEMKAQDEAQFEVLEALQPHTNIRKLSIWSYRGVDFPRWVVQDMMLPNLVSVTLLRCTNIKFLPHLGQLHKLKYLRISGMNEVKRIGHEFCGDGEIKAFPSLKNLRFFDMDNLEEWCGVEEGELPCLQALQIKDCPKLLKLPILLSAVEILKLTRCDQLTSLPKLPSLRDLQLSKCSEMSLRRWFISLLEDDKGMPATLTDLMIINCENLKSLPMELRNLTSLKVLKICYCSQLLSLPEEGLPTTLQHLTMDDCPKLKERCRKDQGEDWPKISHIPRIEIDNEKIS